MTSILLEATGLAPLSLDRDAGYIVRRLDLGDAETRVVAENAPDANGTIDTTRLTGARTIALTVRLIPRPGVVPAALVARLRSFTSVRLRPVMTVQRAGVPDQRLVLRRGPFSAPIERPHFQDVTVQWVCPSGVIEGATLNVAIVYASALGAELGRNYSTDGVPPNQGLNYSIGGTPQGRYYPTSVVLGSATIVNAGDEAAYPLLRVYGPCTNPVITNVTEGKSMAFTGLALLAGEYLEIDTRAKTIRFNGLANDSRYNSLVFPTSSWLSLLPGANIFRFLPATSSPPSNVEVTWRDAYQ